MSSKLAPVTVLYSRNCREIAKMLRALADDIETGPLQEVNQVVCSVRTPDNRTNHYAWGDLNPHQMLSLYTAGIDVVKWNLNQGPILQTEHAT